MFYYGLWLKFKLAQKEKLKVYMLRITYNMSLLIEI